MNRCPTYALALAGAALMASPAQADCDANNLYNYSFNSAPVTTLSYGGSSSYTAANPLGATRGFTVGIVANGMASTTASNGSTNVQLPRIDSAVLSSSSGGKVLTIGGTLNGRTASITSGTRMTTTTFTFAVPIRDLKLGIHDIDFGSNSFRDWIHFSGSDGTTTYTPALSTPFGNNNSGTPTATGSSVRFGPGSTFTPSITAGEAIGISSSGNQASNIGNINLSFAQPVRTVTLRYGNFPLQGGENTTGLQYMGVSTVSFCPMPAVAVAKTSAPYATSGAARFNAPGADVAYALVVTNSGGSPVDLASLALTDTLPANVTFYNGDYDAASPGMGPFQIVAGSSGLTLPSGSAAFSQNGATYGYVPASGYDPSVRAVRVSPTGSLAANSSVTIRFRAQVK